MDDERVRRKTALLVVHDDPDTRATYRAGLEAVGMEVVEAQPGEALRAAHTTRPGIVVADLRTSTADLCRAIRSDAELRSTRIVVVAAIGGAAERATLRDAAPDAVLIKPVDVNQFAGTCLGLHRAGVARDRP